MWVFPKIRVPQNGWEIMENPKRVDDLGVPPLKETPMWFVCLIHLFAWGRQWNQRNGECHIYELDLYDDHHWLHQCHECVSLPSIDRDWTNNSSSLSGFFNKQLRFKLTLLLMVQKSCDHQLRLVVEIPIVYKVLYIPRGAGFLPSIVVDLNCGHNPMCLSVWKKAVARTACITSTTETTSSTSSSSTTQTYTVSSTSSRWGSECLWW